MTKPAPITKKQETIISLIFRFRFLNRTQIQKFLNHKDEARINEWLKELTEKEYLERTYSKRFPENTKPAVYHMAKNGINLVKTQNNNDSKIVQKLYREKDRTASFVNSCILVADIYLDLQNRTTEKLSFDMQLKSDYATHQFGKLLNEIKPHAYIEQKTPEETKRYFLEVLAYLPNEQLRQRIKKYLNFYQGNEWEGETREAFPTALIVCPDDKILKYVRQYTRTKFIQLDEPDLVIHFTTTEQVKAYGITGDIWKKA